MKKNEREANKILDKEMKRMPIIERSICLNVLLRQLPSSPELVLLKKEETRFAEERIHHELRQINFYFLFCFRVGKIRKA